MSARVHSFVKWAGGKSQLFKQMKLFFPPKFNRYFEPFLGGGAVFFNLRPENAFLSDSNYELITTFDVIKEDLEALLQELRTIQQQELSLELYERYQRMDPMKLSLPKCATRFIFLNKTCYNGLYRVNNNGKFNVPMGRHARMPKLFNETNLRGIQDLLQHVRIDLMDYEVAVDRAENADFVYLDPPYLPDDGTNGFTSYTKEAFSLADENKLVKVFQKLDEKGCFVMLSNPETSTVRSLFSKYSETIFPVRVARMINSDSTKRTGFRELLITNYEPEMQTLMHWAMQNG